LHFIVYEDTQINRKGTGRILLFLTLNSILAQNLIVESLCSLEKEYIRGLHLVKNIQTIDTEPEKELNYTMGVIILIMLLTLVVCAYLYGLI
jgi:hypothetical protein